MSARVGPGPRRLHRSTRVLVVAATVFVVSLLIVPRLVRGYVSWLWFGEVGFRGVWLTVLFTRLTLFAAIALIIGGVLLAVMWLAFRFRPLFFPESEEEDSLRPYRTAVLRHPVRFGLGVATVVGLVCGLAAQSNWMTVQLFLHGGSFGVADPQFGHDVGFFVFDLPFYRSVLNWLFIAVVLAFLANLATHYLLGGLRLSRKAGGLTHAARVQLAILAGAFILLKAAAYWLDRYSLLSSDSKEPTFAGPGYTDINAVLPARLILFAIALICAVAVFAAVVVRDLRIPAMAAALLLLSSILVGAVWPLAVEQFSVRPNAADMERVYIQRNIAATRQAYGIGSDRVEYQPYSGVGTKPPPEVPADVTTIADVRLLDPNVLSRTFTQQQQLKNFYSFPPHLDLDRYRVGGQLRDYVVAARELTPSALSGNQRHWVNRHTVYTHGNGFVAAPANRVNAAVREAAGDAASSNSGYPIYAVGDIASQASGHQVIRVDQPRVYFGEVIAHASPDYAIVGGGPQPREYDTDTTTYTYTGAGGVPIGNWLNRLAFAVTYTERNIVFSKAIGAESKIIFNRDPRHRVELVAPWLTTDNDPYPAVVNGRIVWIVDAYTSIDGYPYAKRSSLEALAPGEDTERGSPREISYVRNSIKATVDAYDGTVTLYQVDRQDPVLAAWMKVFPGTVRPEESITPELRAHFRYPEDLFTIQREMLAKYHVDEPREFFTTNAFWSVPSDPTVEANPHQPPFYVLVGDQTSAEPSFRLASAMVGYNREFLSAYVSARSDPEGYGKITVSQLPTDTLTQGPQQIQNSMISDTRVASERTLLERSNRIQYGNLLTLPIADGGVLYAEPLFTERISTAPNSSTFPQLARVLVSYRDPGTGGVLVGYAPTLAEALEQVFGAATGRLATPPGGGPGAPLPPGQQPTAPPAAQPPAQAPPVDQAKIAELNAQIDEIRAALERLQKQLSELDRTGR
ncbi:UPF0182 family protein [Nocardia sp. CDC186]|uniref:UPF0182 protein U3653_10265 n=1 Tax=Nocardia implantans TaxID=3108168 RepID=A0ABU6ASE1_9NOCA|nr:MULTISPECIES: UPF0182 family protein [unclassified Nocardia]MBF6191842.1 UPF0182 family protein [Nocardia beijingensis]MEA3527847.1 UPF0182 family protein [Nocardia sp. CDC192]MEB3510402.1 UPF0182 family protein [Nocardia sp. CDC186]